MTDILSDFHQRLIEIGFNDPKIERIVMDVRRDWAGERPYIGVRYEADKRMSERNRAIIRDYKNGEQVQFLARRYGISIRRIWQIIRG